MTSRTQRVRVESPEIVETMAHANHAEFTHSTHAAAVTLADVTYFWAA